MHFSVHRCTFRCIPVVRYTWFTVCILWNSFDLGSKNVTWPLSKNPPFLHILWIPFYCFCVLYQWISSELSKFQLLVIHTLGVTALESRSSKNLYLYRNHTGKKITGTCIMAYIFGLKQATKMGLNLLRSPLTATSIRVNKFSSTSPCWLIQTLFQQEIAITY